MKSPNVLILYLLFMTVTVEAHHGFGGRYDRSQPIYLEGRVTAAYFGYPHAELDIEVDATLGEIRLPENASEFISGLTRGDISTGKTIEIEFPPVRRFFDLDGRVTVGESVALIVLRNCDPPHQLRGQWIALANGTSVVREGRMQSEVKGC